MVHKNKKVNVIIWSLLKGHAACKGWIWDLNPGLPGSKGSASPTVAPLSSDTAGWAPDMLAE